MRHVAGVAGGRVAAGTEGRLHTRQVRVRLPEGSNFFLLSKDL